MAKLFTRIKETITSDIHQLLDQKEAKNPMAALNKYLRQSEQEKEKVSSLIDRQRRLRDEFSREFHKADHLAAKRLQQAEVAERAAETDLHAYALEEYESYKARAERMKLSRDEAAQQLDNLEQKFEEMKHKIKDMHLKRMDLMGRENIARAHAQMENVMNEHSADQPFSRFAEIESYIEGLEHRINQAHEASTFDSKIAKLERAFMKDETVVKS